MPLFEYRCQDCHALTEVLAKLSDPAPATCPTCGKTNTLTKELSLTSFQLKGGGWYKDLYASAPKDGASAASTNQSSKGESAPTVAAASGPASAAPATAAPAAAAPASPAPTKGGSGTGGSSSSSGGASGGSAGGAGGGGSSAAAAV